LKYDDAIVYPSIEEEAAKGGSLNTTNAKKITVKFNCLGIEEKTVLVLTFDIPLYLPVVLNIEKECSKGKVVIYTQ
jgi:hypothetical protein